MSAIILLALTAAALQPQKPGHERGGGHHGTSRPGGFGGSRPPVSNKFAAAPVGAIQTAVTRVTPPAPTPSTTVTQPPPVSNKFAVAPSVITQRTGVTAANQFATTQAAIAAAPSRGSSIATAVNVGTQAAPVYTYAYTDVIGALKAAGASDAVVAAAAAAARNERR